jgi:hypothetical protein
MRKITRVGRANLNRCTAMIQRLALVTVVLGLACVRLGSTQELGSRPGSRTCNREWLAQALAVDTSRLAKQTVEGPDAQSSEGRTTTVYSEGSRPRVVYTSSYGEIGYTASTYFLMSTSDFVVQTDEVTYAEPISAGPVRIASKERRTGYFCAGQPLGGTELSAHEVTDVLASALRLVYR